MTWISSLSIVQFNWRLQGQCCYYCMDTHPWHRPSVYDSFYNLSRISLPGPTCAKNKIWQLVRSVSITINLYVSFPLNSFSVLGQEGPQCRSWPCSWEAHHKDKGGKSCGFEGWKTTKGSWRNAQEEGMEPFVQFHFYALYRRRPRKESSVRERNRRLRDNTIMKEVMSMLLFADPSL